MLAAQTIINRLLAEVPLLGSVEGAAELAALMAAPVQVWVKPRAHVVPLGLRGGAVQAMTGAFVQSIETSFAVFLTFAAHGDRKGAKRLEGISEVQTAVIRALCGWVPTGNSAAGEVRLSRGYLAELKPGVVVYAIEFSVPDQLRIM